MRVPDTSGLVQRKLDEFNSIRIKTHVGVNEDSLAALNRKYTADNAELPNAVQFNADQIVEKFLAAITFPASLAAHADSLLNTDSQHISPQFYVQPVAAAGAIPAVPGGWRRVEVVSYFDEMWRAAWKRGDPELKFATATMSQDRAGPSPCADGMAAEEVAYEAREYEAVPSLQRHIQYVDSLFAANDSAERRGRMRRMSE